MKSKFLLFSLLVLLASCGGGSDGGDPNPNPGPMTDPIEGDYRFTTVVTTVTTGKAPSTDTETFTFDGTVVNTSGNNYTITYRSGIDIEVEIINNVITSDQFDNDPNFTFMGNVRSNGTIDIEIVNTLNNGTITTDIEGVRR